MSETLPFLSPLQQMIKQYIYLNEISQRQLAKMIGIDHTALSRFCAGHDISFENYSKILIWVITKENEL